MGKVGVIQGKGINDVVWPVYTKVGGKYITEPSYVCFKNMYKRCYHKSEHEYHPLYLGCEVSDEWINYSVFHEWFKDRYKPGYQLDKDILIPGNKIYSPETCVMIPQSLNKFITDRVSARGEWPLGVYLHRPTGKFRAQCSNPFNNKREHIGLFIDAHEAHLAWKRRKHELACQYADQLQDDLLAEALRSKYRGDI